MTVLEHRQLTLDGGEESLQPAQRARRAPGLSPNQRAVIQFAREHGGMVSPGQAGKIVHQARARAYKCGSGGKGGMYDPFLEVPGRVACCPYASSDGLTLLHALERRGLVERISKGIYALVDA